jgi:hypothetical protein
VHARTLQKIMVVSPAAVPQMLGMAGA